MFWDLWSESTQFAQALLSEFGACDNGEECRMLRMNADHNKRINWTWISVIFSENLPIKNRQLQNEMNVAFFARMQAYNEHKSANQILIFEDAVINVGNGYDISTSIFTAPVSGIYVFMCSIHAFNNNGANFNVNIMHNSDRATRFRADGVDQTSGNAILNLRKGDRVFVRIENGHDLWIFGHIMSTFAGFLQQEDFTTNPVIG